MTDKRYPTRMHEVLGVETGELFSIYEFADDELAYVDTNGNVLSAKNNIPVGPYTLTVAINHGITRRPRLSEVQVKKLHAALLLGFKWLAVNSVDELWLFGTKPRKFNLGWGEGTFGEARIVFKGNSDLSSLVSWSDPEPLDIEATLKANGGGCGNEQHPRIKA